MNEKYALLPIVLKQQRILDNDSHILSSPLPPKSDNHSNLHKKRHDRTFLQKKHSFVQLQFYSSSALRRLLVARITLKRIPTYTLLLSCLFYFSCLVAVCQLVFTGI